MAGNRRILTSVVVVLLASVACSFPLAVKSSPPPATSISPIDLTDTAPPPATLPAAASVSPSAESTATSVSHLVFPPDSIPSGKLIYDVVSQDTAPDKRAPYGDSYGINRLERPFLQDMTYVADLDIASFTVSSDSTWWYLALRLVGKNPNDKSGIDYGVELDLDHDGFGDYLIWGHGPYPATWDTAPVQIFRDQNHDTGGLSGERSDAPMTKPTDGYESLIFHGGSGDPDPDVAWIRTGAGNTGEVDFAFKRSWSGSVFMLGVLADAGLRDPGKLDYVDRFTLAQAGSPLRDNTNYPLKALFAVDNVCRAAFGFKPTGDEPQLCPSLEPPATKRPKATDVPTPYTPPIIR